MRAKNGQISLFLALTSVLVFALILTALESSRVAVLRYLTKQAAGSAMESVFAAYDSDALEHYGLLVTRGRAGGSILWTERAEAYLRKYLAPTEGTLRKGDAVALKELAIDVPEAVYITEGNGQVFRDAALAYMKGSGTGTLLRDILEKLDLGSPEEAGNLKQLLERLAGCDDYELSDILGDYTGLQSQVNELLEDAKKRAEEAVQEAAEGLSENAAGGTSGEGLASELLEQLKSLAQNGILSLLTGREELSGLDWRSADLPSKLSSEEKGLHGKTPGAEASLEEKLLLGEYMLECFSCFTEQKIGGRLYEAEYILSGKSSEKAALESVALKLLAIRTGLNLAYLMTDEAKLEQVSLAAAALMSALALPQLTPVLKGLLLTAWAAAEAAADLRALFQGKRVPLWKSAASWKLTGLSMKTEAAQKFEPGLSYRDYLRLLFLTADDADTAYRMMDAIQLRLRKGNPDFLMCEHMVCASAELSVSVGILYLQYPALRRLSGAGQGWCFHQELRYAY